MVHVAVKEDPLRMLCGEPLDAGTFYSSSVGTVRAVGISGAVNCLACQLVASALIEDDLEAARAKVTSMQPITRLPL